MQIEMPDALIQKDPLRLLLVEDNAADVKIALMALQKTQIQNTVTVARDGEEALEKMTQERPDFVLMDIRMPRMDGFMALEKIKSDPKLRGIPVAMLTTSKNPQDIHRSYDLGAVSYIQKPDRYQDFVSILDCLNVYWRSVSKVPKS